MLFWTCTKAGTEAEGITPVPLKLTVCGLLLALSLMVSVPALVPVAVGVKVTLRLQPAPAARLEVQPLARVKSVGFAPPVTMLVIAKPTVPVLVRVEDCGALGVATAVLGKMRELGDALAVVVTPVPDRAAVTAAIP